MVTGKGKLVCGQNVFKWKCILTEAAGFHYAGVLYMVQKVVENVHERSGTEWDAISAKDKFML